MRKHIYDLAGQIRYIEERDASGNLIWLRTCQYDLNGNITQTITTPTQNADPSIPADSATYDKDNRLSEWNGTSVLHDAEGNMTQGPLPDGTPDGIYTYDMSDRLTSAGGVTSAYNPDGLRVSAGGVNYVIDPNGLSKPLMRNQTKYVWGLGLIYEDTGGSMKTYHPDHLGSTMATTDGAGAVTDRWEYSSYGTESHTTGTTDTPFRFHGALGCITDDNGLIYMRNRFYNPRIMRFLNQDPIGFEGGMNWFAAFGNNPISYVDPTGLLEEYTFYLNGGQLSRLRNTRTGVSYPAFSGNGEYRNDPNSTDIKDNGPLPAGTYYIVDRPTGGNLGSARDWVTGRDKWFALYADDGTIDDSTMSHGVERTNVRLHPGTLSYGCLTLPSNKDFTAIRQELLSTAKSTIPGTSIPYYGTINVSPPTDREIFRATMSNEIAKLTAPVILSGRK